MLGIFVKEVQYQSRIFKHHDQEGNRKNLFGVCDEQKVELGQRIIA